MGRLVRDDPSTLLDRFMPAENLGHFESHLRKAGDRDGAGLRYGEAVEILRGTPPCNVIDRYNRPCFLAQYSDLLPRAPGRPTPIEARRCRALADEAMTHLRDAVRSGFQTPRLSGFQTPMAFRDPGFQRH